MKNMKKLEIGNKVWVVPDTIPQDIIETKISFIGETIFKCADCEDYEFSISTLKTVNSPGKLRAKVYLSYDDYVKHKQIGDLQIKIEKYFAKFQTRKLTFEQLLSIDRIICGEKLESIIANKDSPQDITSLAPPKEEWQPIKGYEGKYMISNYGNIFNEIKKSLLEGKRRRVILYTNKTKIGYDRAKLVAEYFLPNPEKYRSIGFKDGNQSNCIVTNLYWRDRPNIKVVHQLDLNDRLLCSYQSVEIASLLTGICHSSIQMCANSKVKTAGGFRWKYNEE